MASSTPKKPQAADYGADQIVALEGLEPVRMRPGMYIGGTDARGLHHLIWEIVDNAVDEALAGYCSEIVVEVKKDGVVTVSDDGRGIPVGKNSKTGEYAVLMVFEELHAGGKFGGGGYKVSGGLHGVGASVTNALSEWLTVDVHREGSSWAAAWSRGKRTHQLKKGKGVTDQGTTVSWMFDREIFREKTIKYDPQLIERRLREKSYLVRGLKFILRVEGEKERVFQSKLGIAEYVSELSAEREPLHAKVISLETDAQAVTRTDDSETEIGVDVALQWTKKPDERLYSFANIVTTPDGGAHVTGLRSAVTRVMNNYGMDTGKLKRDKKDDRLDAKDVFAALTSAVSVKIEDAQFEGQTKGRLNNPEARTAVQTFVTTAFGEWVESKKNQKPAKEILERCLHARKVRLAQGKVSKNYNPNSIWADSGQSAKLADCEATVPAEEREIFIVEGDSAGGTAKEARDGSRQAILPLKGKPINVLTSSNSKVFDNKEIQAIVTALGGRIDQVDGENVVTLPREQRRYGKVIITADADTDGAHISYLVIAIFHELFPDMLKEGRVFLARPPLFKVNLDARGETVSYVYPEEDLNALLKKSKRTGDDVTRFKGLGEMDAEHLEETVMSPATRQLLQVTIEDAAEVAESLNLILGNSAAKRKEWLESGGANVSLSV